MSDRGPLSTLPCPPFVPDWLSFASRLVLDHAAALKAGLRAGGRREERQT